MPTIKLSDTEVLQVIHHCNNLDMVKHLADKLKASINNQGKEKAPVASDPVHERNLSERFHLLEALRNQLNVSNWDQMSGALANLKQNHVEAERDLEKEVEVSKYLRSCLQEIGRALHQTNLTPASVTETALVYIKDKESTEHPDTYRVRSIKCALGNMSGHKYQDVLRRINDIVEQDIHTGPVRSLHQFDAENKLNKVEAFLIDPTKLYTACDTNQTHMRVWSIACQLMEIIKGKGAVYAAADPTVFAAQKAADEASDPLRMAEAKISELEAKLAQGEQRAAKLDSAMRWLVNGRQFVHKETYELASKVREILNDD